ncbi:MAG: hypothetical protein ACK4WC_00065 [Rubrimonas sp.]
MPVNPEATLFERVQRWEDAVQSGQAWTRARADLYLDDVAAGINAALRAARRKPIPLSALPPFGNVFERVVTANPDGSLSLREWQGSAWAELATITAAGLLTRSQEMVSYRDVIVGLGNTVPVQVLSASNPANGRAYSLTIMNAAATTYWVGEALRPAAGGDGVLIEHDSADCVVAFSSGAVILTPAENGADNFHILVRRSL